MFLAFNRTRLVIFLVMFFGMVLWMAYFFYFRSDGRGHVLREAESPEAAARGQQLLGRADALTNQHQYDAAKSLLDSLQNADANPAMFISDDDLAQRMDTLRQRRYREKSVQ